MKKITIIVSFIILATSQLQAQVNREVEVTKAYIPTVAKAEKPQLVATIADTAYINPDVDYSITPLSINTQLQTRPINPATVTYWEFNQPTMAQIKVGAGYPLNSLLQAYASTHNASVGYLAANIDHVGNYSNIKSSSGDMVSAIETLNSGSIAAGLYLGGRTLAADLSYSNDIYSNYAFEQTKSSLINYQQIATSVSFGDSFVDLSSLNFRVGGAYSYFFDTHSNVNNNILVGGSVGKNISLGRLILDASYKNIGGGDSYSNHTAEVVLSLERSIEKWHVDLGVGYIFDQTELSQNSSSSGYIIPRVRASRTLTNAITPFVEAYGSVEQNSFEQLSQINPYIAEGTAAKSSMEYNFFGGVMGQNNSYTLSYKLYAGYQIGINSRLWGLTIIEEPSYTTSDIYCSYFDLALSDLYTASANAEVSYSPIGSLTLQADGHVYAYSNSSSAKYINHRPTFEASLGAEYTLRRFRVGVKASVISERSYSAQYLTNLTSATSSSSSTAVHLPAAVDLSAYLDWQINSKWALFAQGKNLCNANLYPWPLYRGYGAQFTAGVKINFR